MNKFSVIVLTAAIASCGLLKAAEVDNREANQEKRIEQGEKSGELTQKEAAHLEKDQQAIHNEVQADRAANGGKLSKEEKKEVNKQLNKESHKIHRKKHNKVKATDAK